MSEKSLCLRIITLKIRIMSKNIAKIIVTKIFMKTMNKTIIIKIKLIT